MSLREAIRFDPTTSPHVQLRERRADVARAKPRARSTSQALGASERLFVTLRRSHATNVVRVLAIEGTLRPSAIRAALRALQLRHPMMRAAIVDGDAPRFLHDEALPIRLHVVERQDEGQWQRMVEGLLDTPIPQRPGSLFEAYHLVSERSLRSELILVGDHAVCDGISMNHLAAELAGLCAGEAPKAARPILPVLEALLPSFSADARIASFASSLARFARLALLRSLHESREAPRSTSYARLELERDETRALVARTRAEKTTITGALMACVMIAVKERRPRLPRLAMSVPINLRPRIPDRGLEPDDLANLTSVAYLDSRAEGDPWAIARAMKAQLEAEVRGDRLLAALPLVYRTARALLRPGRPTFAHAMLSSSGVVPLRRDYGPFRVVGFYSATSAPMISADYSFFCNTFDGRLCVNLLFAEEVVSRADAEQVLARIRALLLEGSEAGR